MTDVKCQQLKIQLNDSLTISAEMLALTALSFHLARDNITHALTQLLTHTLTAHLNKLIVKTIPEKKYLIQGA